MIMRNDYEADRPLQERSRLALIMTSSNTRRFALAPCSQSVIACARWRWPVGSASGCRITACPRSPPTGIFARTNITMPSTTSA